MVSQQQMSQSFPDHPTLEHICVCTNLAEIDLSPSVYCSAYHSTTNYLSSVHYSCNPCINSSNYNWEISVMPKLVNLEEIVATFYSA